MNCGNIGLLISSGSVVDCPWCGSSTAVTYQGKLTLAFFNAFADGYQGFVPTGARYSGSGNFSALGSGLHLNNYFRNDTNFSQLNGATGEAQLGRTPETFFNHPQNPALPPPRALNQDLIDAAARELELDFVYRAARSILSGNNPCSQFYGGSGPATTILDALYSSLQIAPLSNPLVGISMNVSPPTGANLHSAGGGVQYRIPNSATVNSSGIFFRLYLVGTYNSNSLAGQITQLFHEGAHLTVTSGGALRIPNDGFSALVSRMNTGNVLNACRSAIDAATAPRQTNVNIGPPPR